MAEQLRVVGEEGVGAVIRRALKLAFGDEYWFEIDVKVRRRSDYPRRGNATQVVLVCDEAEREAWQRDLAAWEAKQ